MAPRSSTSLPKRTTLTYKQRLELCEHKRSHPHMNHGNLADWVTWHFNLPKAPSEASVRSILNNEEKWRQELENAVDSNAANTMRKKPSVHAPQVEAALLKWLVDQPRDVKVKGREIQAKAEELAVTLGIPEGKRPKFSKGWLGGFQERYNLKSPGSASRKRPSLSEPIPARIVLTYKQRMELCDHAESNPTLNKTQLAEWATHKFHLRKYISIHAVSRIVKNADKWKRVPSREAKVKRHWREPMSPEIDALLVNWIHKRRERNIKATGREIVEKGHQFAADLGIAPQHRPKFSKGWLSSFMRRHKLMKQRLPKSLRDVIDRQVGEERIAAQVLASAAVDTGADGDIIDELEDDDEEEELASAYDDDDEEEQDDDEHQDEEEEEEEEENADLNHRRRKKTRVAHLLN